VLTAGLTAATTEVEDVNGRPSGGVELEVRKHPPSTLRNVDGGPWEVPELKVRERPPST
jgi:hypothetical protein